MSTDSLHVTSARSGVELMSSHQLLSSVAMPFASESRLGLLFFSCHVCLRQVHSVPEVAYENPEFPEGVPPAQERAGQS